MNPETKLMNQIQCRASVLGWRLFRNTVGLGWLGTAYPTADKATVLLKNARRVRIGLGTGTSDHIGWKPVVVTQEMVGTIIAVFTAVEVKTGQGRVTVEQQNFVDTVSGCGGHGLVARSVDDL